MPPYVTPELGDAPKEMRDEAGRIYRALRKDGYEDERAAPIMWASLKKRWKKKGDKWVPRETKSNAREAPMMQIPSGGAGASQTSLRCTRFRNTVLQGLDQWLPDDKGRVQGTYYPKSAFEPTVGEWGQGVPIVYAAKHVKIGGLARDSEKTLRDASTDEVRARIVGYSVGVALLSKNIGRPLLKVDLGDICDAEVQNLYDDARLGISSAFTDRETDDGKYLVGDIHPDHILLFPRDALTGTEQRDLSAVVSTLNQLGVSGDVTDSQENKGAEFSRKNRGRIRAFVETMRHLAEEASAMLGREENEIETLLRRAGQGLPGAKRDAMEVADEAAAQRENFNPDHDERGRFTSGGGGDVGGMSGEELKGGIERIVAKGGGASKEEKDWFIKAADEQRRRWKEELGGAAPLADVHAGLDQWKDEGVDPDVVSAISGLVKMAEEEKSPAARMEILAEATKMVDETMQEMELDSGSGMLEALDAEVDRLSETAGRGPKGSPSGRSHAKSFPCVPKNPAKYGKGTGSWTKPALSDYTKDDWDDLTESERGRIRSHFAAVTDDTFGGCKLGHHEPDGTLNANGVRAALGRAGQTDGLSGIMESVMSHLEAHSKEFGEENSETNNLPIKEEVSMGEGDQGNKKLSEAEAAAKRIKDLEAEAEAAKKRASDAEAALKDLKGKKSESEAECDAKDGEGAPKDDEDLKDEAEGNRKHLADLDARIADLTKKMSEKDILEEAAKRRDFVNLLKPGAQKVADELYKEFRADPTGFMKARANVFSGSSGETDLTGLEHIPGGKAGANEGGPFSETAIRARAAQLGVVFSDSPEGAVSTEGRCVYNTQTNQREWVPLEVPQGGKAP